VDKGATDVGAENECIHDGKRGGTIAAKVRKSQREEREETRREERREEMGIASPCLVESA
jgi:hypothetical protein